jgi:hypothetical protein
MTIPSILRLENLIGLYQFENFGISNVIGSPVSALRKAIKSALPANVGYASLGVLGS